MSFNSTAISVHWLTKEAFKLLFFMLLFSYVFFGGTFRHFIISFSPIINRTLYIRLECPFTYRRLITYRHHLSSKPSPDKYNSPLNHHPPTPTTNNNYSPSCSNNSKITKLSCSKRKTPSKCRSSSSCSRRK